MYKNNSKLGCRFSFGIFLLLLGVLLAISFINLRLEAQETIPNKLEKDEIEVVNINEKELKHSESITENKSIKLDIGSENIQDLFISEINFSGSFDDDYKCRKDKNLDKKSQCSYDKWIEIYNPSNVDINLSEYSIFTDYFDSGKNIKLEGWESEVGSLEGVVVKANDYIILYDSRSSLSSIIKNLDTNQQSVSNLYKISSKSKTQKDVYNNISFYISKNSESDPILEFRLDSYQTNISANIYSTLEFCNQNQNNFQKSNQLFYSDQDTKYFASPGEIKDCDGKTINSINEVNQSLGNGAKQISPIENQNPVQNIEQTLANSKSLNNEFQKNTVGQTSQTKNEVITNFKENLSKKTLFNSDLSTNKIKNSITQINKYSGRDLMIKSSEQISTLSKIEKFQLDLFNLNYDLISSLVYKNHDLTLMNIFLLLSLLRLQISKENGFEAKKFYPYSLLTQSNSGYKFK
jgi:hypothetical protein